MTNQTLQHETCKHANMKHANQRSRLPCKVLIGTVKSRQYLFIILLFFFLAQPFIFNMVEVEQCGIECFVKEAKTVGA